MLDNTIEIPKYKCTKEVWALKIEKIENDDIAVKQYGGGLTIFPEDKRFLPIYVNSTYKDKHNPKAGGYYVRYKDGYESWSPAEAFETGYVLIK